MRKFKNKIALVTGGTSGIGKEIVKELLSLVTIVMKKMPKIQKMNLIMKI